MLGKSEPEIGVGIDFGTSNSSSGVYINGAVKIVPNKIGERITPSIILFKTNKKINQNNKEEIKEEIFVGEDALCEPIGNIRNYIYEIKRFIGLDYEELEESGFKESLNYEIVNEDGIPKVKIEFNGQYKYYTIEEISAIIIKKIMQSTEDFIAEILDSKGLKIKNAVFTVPSQFTDQQKKSILDAAKLAGIEVPRIINEPTAAALAYGIGKDLTYSKKNSLLNSTAVGVDYDVAPSANQFIKSEEKVMIFDLGGGTLDITILNINKNQDNSLNFDVLVTRGDIHLGGSDFDKILMDNCIKIFCEDNNINKDDLTPLILSIVSFHSIENPSTLVSSDEIPQIDINIQPFKLNFSQFQLISLLSLYQAIKPELDFFLSKPESLKEYNNVEELIQLGEEKKEEKESIYPPQYYDKNLNVLSLGSIPQQLIYESENHWMFFVKNIHIGSLEISVTTRIDLSAFEDILPSFLLGIISALGNVFLHITDYKLKFTTSLFRDVFTDIYSLSNTLYNTYYDQCIHGLFRIVGNLDIIGNPTGYASSIADGFLQIIEAPRKGLVNGPLGFGEGIAKGFGTFITTVLSSTFDVVGKISGTLLASCEVLQGEKVFEQLEDREPEHVFEGLYVGLKEGVIDLGKGIGEILYKRLEAKAINMGIRNIVSIITSSNQESIKFHTKMGFLVDGIMKNFGYKNNLWLGVYYMSKNINPFDENPKIYKYEG
jgi:hypothetical protein